MASDRGPLAPCTPRQESKLDLIKQAGFNPSDMAAELAQLEDTIDYRFRKRELLEQAVTHSSYSRAPTPSANNERLEFLGDSILGFIVSERLSAQFPTRPEGELTKLRASLVSAANLVKVAEALDIGAYLRLGRGEEISGGREKKTLLVNAFEALVAAVYLDGGIEAACQLVGGTVLTVTALDGAVENLALDNNKSALQELLQASQLPAPVYEPVGEVGPPHSKVFTIEVRVGELFSARGEGSSKKSAEQQAAELALEFFRSHQHQKITS